MAQRISIRGSIVTGESTCSSSGGLGQCARQLSLGGGCGDDGLSYDAVLSGSAQVETPGAIGAVYHEIMLAASLSQVEFLYVKATARVKLRIGSKPSVWTGTLLGSVAFTGQTFDWTANDVVAEVTFPTATLTPEQIVARINSAAALAGMPTPVASIGSNGGLRLETPVVGREAEQSATGALALLGLSGNDIAPGEGEIVDVAGLALLQFPRSPNAPVRIDVSGSAQVEIIVAGRPA